MPSGQMRSVDARHFSIVPRSDVGRSAFDRPSFHKTTMDVGLLYPVFVDEVLPGDSISVRMHAFARLATPIVPVMDNLVFESFFFFVPYRILWSNFERFMGEQTSPTDSTDFVVPQVAPAAIDFTGFSIFDYMGVRINQAVAGSLSVSALPFRAYNLIWNEWFRDQDIQVKLTENTGDGPDAVANYFLWWRGKRHDYFTSARPWPQKPVMQPAVGGWTAGDQLRQVAGGRDFFWTQYNTVHGAGAPVSGLGYAAATTSIPGPEAVKTPGGRTDTWSPLYSNSGMRVRTSQTDGSPDVRVLVNDIRTAMQIQNWMEKNARGGTRYAEIIRAHFGVVSPDARLQRPEYLGGGRSFVGMNPVAQTSATGSPGTSTVLGEQAATATISAYSHGFSQSFTEHGVILGLVNVRGELTYQQGVERMWFRKSKFDFYWPEFAHLPEQAVYSKELFCDGTAGDNDVFGYQERWAEYKYKPSRVSGAFNSSLAAPLDVWHFAQFFASRPTLNHNFIIEVPAVQRALQAPSATQHFLVDMLFEQRSVRPMPMYSIPGLGGRF